MLATARAQWPQVAFDEDTLAPFVGERLVGPDLPSALAAAPAADLALAGACAAQEPTAHAAFDAVLVEVDSAGAAVNATKDLVDEVKQLLRLQLLVAKDGKPPGIVGYRGKGPLRGWVRITATRELIRHKKKRQRDVPLGRSLEGMLTSGGDPALEALKAEYRSEFAAALREAIELLSAEDRTLLRQQIVDGMSIDAIGVAFGVHRATAARWLTRARAALVAATHRRLADRLKLPVDQIESVIRLVQSKLDASVVRYLKAQR
jgi:RNA polymerase sigma-70 factor (ECF subfamily)